MVKMDKIYLSMLLFLSSFNLIETSLKFNIPSHRDKCFSQELYMEGTLLVRYDLTGFERDFKDPASQEELFKSIKVFIKDEKGKMIYETELKSRKEKFAVLLKQGGVYQICTRYFKPRRGGKLLGNYVLMGLKIRNDYSYKKLDDSLHKEDVTNFWKKIREINRDMRPSIEASKLELKAEDKAAKSIIRSINTYYILCIFQLVIIVIITILTIFNYQEFFKKKSII